MKNYSCVFLILLVGSVVFAAPSKAVKQVTLTEEELLGARIFSDPRLSSPQGQSCMSCHHPRAAFSDPRRGLPVSQGATESNFGGRNAPSAMYAKFVPELTLIEEEGEQSYIGGLFWDGRANNLIEQAKGPFLNHLEMGSTKEYVVSQVCSSPTYGDLVKKVFGEKACAKNWTEARVEKVYHLVAKAIASFESTEFFSPFASKFDRVMAKEDTFTEEELRGFQVFQDENKGKCAACHVLDTENAAGKALFTDFTYDNLGIPKNPELKFLGHTAVDVGLAATTGRKEDKGAFRVPTLRNIAFTAPYGHNGYFKTLEQIVDFYNTRDVKPVCKGNLTAEEATKQNCWPRAEVAANKNTEELGNLKMTAQEQKDLIAFLKTLTDGR